MSYAREKLNQSVRTLATGRGRIRERLLDAYISNLHVLNADNFPSDLRSEYKAIHRAFTRLEAEYPEEGKVSASVRALSEDEAVELAGRIVELAARLEE